MKIENTKHNLSVCLTWLILPAYFTIQFIFATIHDPTVLFGTIYGSYYTILANFYFYLPFFQQKIFNFSKISRFQIDPKWILVKYRGWALHFSFFIFFYFIYIYIYLNQSFFESMVFYGGSCAWLDCYYSFRTKCSSWKFEVWVAILISCMIFIGIGFGLNFIK